MSETKSNGPERYVLVPELKGRHLRAFRAMERQSKVLQAASKGIGLSGVLDLLGGMGQAGVGESITKMKDKSQRMQAARSFLEWRRMEALHTLFWVLVDESFCKDFSVQLAVETHGSKTRVVVVQDSDVRRVRELVGDPCDESEAAADLADMVSRESEAHGESESKMEDIPEPIKARMKGQSFGS